MRRNDICLNYIGKCDGICPALLNTLFAKVLLEFACILGKDEANERIVKEKKFTEVYCNLHFLKPQILKFGPKTLHTTTNRQFESGRDKRRK